jgi:hypothetical protein
VDEVDREDEDDPSDPPPPPPDQKVGWKPPPGYMEGPILRPRTDEEIDPAALYGGTQGQLPYNAVATEDEVDIAALMGGTQGQLPYGAVATDDPTLRRPLTGPIGRDWVIWWRKRESMSHSIKAQRVIP